MFGCCAPKCTLTNPKLAKKRSVSFFVFPRDKETQTKWKKFCNIGEDIDVHAIRQKYRICSLHFKAECFKRDLKSELSNTTPKKILLPNGEYNIVDRLINKFKHMWD